MNSIPQFCSVELKLTKMKEIELAKNECLSLEILGSGSNLKVLGNAQNGLKEVYLRKEVSYSAPECWGIFGKRKSASTQPVIPQITYHQQAKIAINSPANR
jgi:hypothetical protein